MLRSLLVVGLAGASLALPASASAFAVPSQMRLVAYYPAANGWTYMWDRWHPRQIDRDFGLVQGLGANTVRVFVQPVAFGFPRPTAAASAKLATVLSLAGKHGLAVELTLFDWWFDYADIADSETWVRGILAPYAGDPRLAAVEVRNEIDPSSTAAVTWAKELIPFVRTVVPGVPVTLSASPNDPLRVLTQLSRALAPVAPDFWSFHYYDKPENAYWVIAAARAAVAPVPLVVGETGYQPSLSVPAPRTHAEADAERERYFRTLMDATALLGMPPAGVWDLLDFTSSGSPLSMPAAQYRFGLFRADGAPKPAAAVVRDAFAEPGRVDASFDGDFEQPGLGTWRATGDAVRDTAIVHGGSGSGEITGRGALTQIPPVPWVTPGEPVALSAWIRGAGTAAIEWFASDHAALGETDSDPVPATGDWTQRRVLGVAPPGAAYFALSLASHGTHGPVRFDDVSVVAGA